MCPLLLEKGLQGWQLGGPLGPTMGCGNLQFIWSEERSPFICRERDRQHLGSEDSLKDFVSFQDQPL